MDKDVASSGRFCGLRSRLDEPSSLFAQQRWLLGLHCRYLLEFVRIVPEKASVSGFVLHDFSNMNVLSETIDLGTLRVELVVVHPSFDLKVPEPFVNLEEIHIIYTDIALSLIHI